VADLAIDYELLHQLAQETDALKNKLSDTRKQNHTYGESLVGPDASLMIDEYYDAWSDAFRRAEHLLESLSGTYNSVAQQWFEQDAQYATVANEQAAGFTHNMWAMKKSAHDSWQKLSQTYVPGIGFDTNGNVITTQVPLADPHQAPEDPGQEPHGYTSADGSQNTTSVYDSNGNLTSNDTTITDGNGGFTYHEHTQLGENGSYTNTVNGPDGSTTIATIQGNPDGTGTKTVETTDPDGKKQTTTYTGTGVNGSDPSWTQVDTTGDQSGNTGNTKDNSGNNHGPKI
jgi:hypothetical protein